MKSIFTFILLFCATLFLTSCSSSDDENTNKIIGTWKSYQSYHDNVLQNDEDLCNREYTLDFGPDGSFTSQSYSELNNDCVAKAPKIGTWNDKGGDIYDIVVNGNSEESKIYFEGSDKIYYLSEGINNNGTYTAKEVYKRQ